MHIHTRLVLLILKTCLFSSSGRVSNSPQVHQHCLRRHEQNTVRVFAVWIHSGVATTGHYWAYLRDFKDNKWRKFNDVFVSDVDEKTVFEDAVGGPNSSVSAYFLVRIGLS